MDNKIIYILCSLKPNQATNEFLQLNDNIIIHNLKEISRLPIVPNPSPPSPEWDLACLENRIRTFTGRWKINFLTAEQMAIAGFYYLGPADRVRCMFCSKELDKWEPTDNPIDEHKRVSPLCTFFKENPGFDVCGLYEPPPITYSTDINVRRVQTFLNSVCIDHKSKVLPANKAYTSFDSRLRTFKNCKTIINQPVRTLCDAGLLYIGNGENDMMLCFCCNQGLKDWEKEDNPWMEHARWSPTCSFVLLMMGKQYVDEVSSQANNAALQETQEIIEDDSGNQPELLEIANNDESSVFPIEIIDEASNIPEINVSLAESSVENDVQPDHSARADSQAMAMMEMSSQQDQSTVANSMLCKICLKDKIEVFFIPCGHAITCTQCAVTLDQCAICRQNLKMLMRVCVYISEDKDDYPNKLACVSPKALDEPVDPMLCKMCHKEEMSIAFLPCKHICACLGCAAKMKECPLCLEPYFALLQVFL